MFLSVIPKSSSLLQLQDDLLEFDLQFIDPTFINSPLVDLDFKELFLQTKGVDNISDELILDNSIDILIYFLLHKKREPQFKTITDNQFLIYLKEIIAVFKAAGIRVSIFVDPSVELVEGAAKTGTDRIELYTEAYARAFAKGEKEAAILDYKLAAAKAKELGLGINAGHDLDRFNLAYLIKEIPYIDEVSIGHALISDAIYLGLENTIQLYKRALSI